MRNKWQSFLALSRCQHWQVQVSCLALEHFFLFFLAPLLLFAALLLSPHLGLLLLRQPLAAILFRLVLVLWIAIVTIAWKYCWTKYAQSTAQLIPLPLDHLRVDVLFEARQLVVLVVFHLIYFAQEFIVQWTQTIRAAINPKWVVPLCVRSKTLMHLHSQISFFNYKSKKMFFKHVFFKDSRTK